MPGRSKGIQGRKLPPGAELLGVDLICGIEVPIVRATAEQCPELLDEPGVINDGFFCGDRSIIVLRSGQHPTQERDSLNHERVHAWIKLSGYDDFEETIARVLAPHLGAGVVSNLSPRKAR